MINEEIILKSIVQKAVENVPLAEYLDVEYIEGWLEEDIEEFKIQFAVRTKGNGFALFVHNDSDVLHHMESYCQELKDELDSIPGVWVMSSESCINVIHALLFTSITYSISESILKVDMLQDTFRFPGIDEEKARDIADLLRLTLRIQR